jgi:hypothetical protein
MKNWHHTREKTVSLQHIFFANLPWRGISYQED